jgi:putative polyhydroxyalkanoic acid system protein
MTEPLVVTISHRLGRAEAKRRLDAGLDHIRALAAPYVSGLECAWHEERLDFRLSALAQTIDGAIEVEDELVRVEIGLPPLLRLLAAPIAGRVRDEGARLLEKPPEA